MASAHGAGRKAGTMSEQHVIECAEQAIPTLGFDARCSRRVVGNLRSYQLISKTELEGLRWNP